MNEAALYLVLAAGTGKDNCSTRWSINAGMTYAGIRWERGQRAIASLVSQGFIRYGEGHTRTKPRYELPSYAEIFPANLSRKRAGLDEWEQRLLDKLKNNVGQGARWTKAERRNLERLVESGIVHRQGDDFTTEFPTIEPDLIWLPNTIVTGTEQGESSPVRRLRDGGDIWTLRLFIDLYHAQNLRDDGGISPQVIREVYERKLVGEQGILKLWAFRLRPKSLYWRGPFAAHSKRPREESKAHPVWENLDDLEKNGLLTFVPHLWTSDSESAEIIHPYGVEGIGGEQEEIKIGDAAHLAGKAIASDARVESVFSHSEDPGDWMRSSYFAPVRHTLPDVQMIGVGRLTYRPHTSRTASWWAELQESASRWISHYQEICEKAENSKRSAAAF